MREQSFDAERAALVLPRDGIGHNDYSGSVLSRYDGDSIGFAFSTVEREVNRVILLGRITALLLGSACTHDDAVLSEICPFYYGRRFLLRHGPRHHAVERIRR